MTKTRFSPVLKTDLGNKTSTLLTRLQLYTYKGSIFKYEIKIHNRKLNLSKITFLIIDSLTNKYKLYKKVNN